MKIILRFQVTVEDSNGNRRSDTVHMNAKGELDMSRYKENEKIIKLACDEIKQIFSKEDLE